MCEQESVSVTSANEIDEKLTLDCKQVFLMTWYSLLLMRFQQGGTRTDLEINNRAGRGEGGDHPNINKIYHY